MYKYVQICTINMYLYVLYVQICTNMYKEEQIYSGNQKTVK